MGRIADFTLEPIVLLGWCLQIALILAVGVRGSRAIRLPETSVSTCLWIITLGWVWRLAYLFVLAAGGFRQWIGDEIVRWLDAWIWLRDPYFANPESPWLSGTSYVHGAAMWLVGDPLYGSKLLSALFCVFPLLGLAVFTQAIFRSRVLAAASALFLAPSWLDILLAGGTMSEMPTVGLMLAGAGLCIEGLREPKRERSLRWLLGAGSCFLAATTLHLVAWFQLAGILLTLLAYLATRGDIPLRVRLLGWVAFCALSTLYCFAWVLRASWMTGTPLGSFSETVSQPLFKIGGPTRLIGSMVDAGGVSSLLYYALCLCLLLVLAVLLFLPALGGREFEGARAWIASPRGRSVRRAVGVASLVAALAAGAALLRQLPDLPKGDLALFATNLAIYPTSLLYCSWIHLPLLLFGVGVTLFDSSRSSAAARWVLVGLFAVMAMLVGTAVIGGANLTPFRTVLLLSSALVPFGLAPLFATAPIVHGSAPEAKPRPRGRALCYGIAALLVAQQAVANHRQVLDQLPVPKIVRAPLNQRNETPDVYALGAWFRSAMISRESGLGPENFRHPIEIVVDDIGGLRQSMLQYLIGDPGLFAKPERPKPDDPERDVLPELQPHQLVISDRPLDSPAIEPIVTVGIYHVYEGRVPEP